MGVVRGLGTLVRVAGVVCAGVCTGVMSPARPAAAEVFYVRTGGCDCADGLSPETALATIRTAAARVREGDRIIVGPGEYEEGDLGPADDGRPGFPIEFLADPTGELTGDAPGPVVLRPPAGRSTGFLLHGREFVVVSGFTILAPADAGVQAKATVDGRVPAEIVVENVTVVDSGRRGVDLEVSGRVAVRSCVVMGSRGAGIAVTGTGEELDVEVVENEVTGNGGNGLFVDRATSGRIERNRAEDNVGAGLFLRRSPGVVVRENILRRNGDAGLQTGTSMVELSDAGGLVISGNVVEANGGSGLRILAGGFVMVEDNQITGNVGSGIAIQGSPGSPAQAVLYGNRLGENRAHGAFLEHAPTTEVMNTVAYSNGATGITVRSSPQVRVVNNLLYDNGEDGVAVGTADAASPDATVAFNTVFGNGGWGLRIGAAGAGSPGALVVYNVLDANTLGEVAVTRESTCGYVAGYNIVGSGRYGPSTPKNGYDLIVRPRFVDPDGADGVLGGEGWRDDDFRLRRTTFDPSPGVDAGPADAVDLGVTGSATEGEDADVGRVDLGFHYGARGGGFRFDRPFLPLYVRSTGDDARDGRAPDRALATLRRAAELARAGVTVVVGPGEYAEGDVSTPANGGLVSFVADPIGRWTGDAAGPVLLDASGWSTGFLLIESCRAEVRGFEVRGAADAAVQVRAGAHGALVADNVLTDSKLGVQVFDADGVRIHNNLLWRNRGGIQVGGRFGSQGTEISNNTVLGSEQVGILIGAGVPAPGAEVRYNIVCGGQDNGIQVSRAGSLEGYRAERNLNCDGYGAGTPEGRLDLGIPPRFVDAAGGDFHLAQVAAGQLEDSPGVDYADVPADGQLAARTTRSDGVPDRGPLDLGYHYPLPVREELHVCAASGSNDAPGTADRPLADIAEALRRAAPGTVVRICPGRYQTPVVVSVPRVVLEGTLGADGTPAVVLESATSSSAPGSTADFALRIEADGVTLRGLTVTGGGGGGIWIGADRVALLDSRVRDNGGDGIRVARGADALLFNVLVHGNDGAGIRVGESDREARNTVIAWTTVSLNGEGGVVVGTAGARVQDVVVAGNVLAGNSGAGVRVHPDALAGLDVAGNCNPDGYEGIARPASDISGDPQFEGDFFLAQSAAGQAAESPCVDAGGLASADLGFAVAWTRSDGVPDDGPADLGYHHGISATSVAALREVLGASCRAIGCAPRAGDCNGDGIVTIDELVRGVRVALGVDAASACAALDLDADGRVGVHELVAAVVAALE